MNSFESIVYDASYKPPSKPTKKVIPAHKPVIYTKPNPKAVVFLAVLIIGLGINVLTYVVR